MLVVVSDHVIVRYLERVPGPHPTDAAGRIDIEAVKKTILADGRKEAFEMGAREVTLGRYTFFARLDKTRGGNPKEMNVITTIHESNDADLRKPNRTKVRFRNA